MSKFRSNKTLIMKINTHKKKRRNHMKLPILIAMVLYMAMVIWIGVIYSKKTKTSKTISLEDEDLDHGLLQ